MEHTAKLVEIKQLSDGAIAARVRCCDEPSTDSWHTIYLSAASQQADIKAWETERADHVKNQHAALQMGLRYLQSRTQQE